MSSNAWNAFASPFVAPLPCSFCCSKCARMADPAKVSGPRLRKGSEPVDESEGGQSFSEVRRESERLTRGRETRV